MRKQPEIARAVDYRNVLGREVEQMLCLELQSNPAWKLLARNFRSRQGEIDLIGEEKSADGRIELVFIEVRARRPGSWSSGIESVGIVKRRRLLLTARKFLAGYRGPAETARWDIWGWDGRAWSALKNADFE